MRHVVSVLLIVTTLAASPLHAAGLVLSPELNQKQTQPAPASEGVEGIDPRTGEVITPIDSTTTTTTTTSEVITPIETPPPQKPGYLSRITGVQWLGIGIAVLAVGAVAAGGGGGDEPVQVPASGGN